MNNAIKQISDQCCYYDGHVNIEKFAEMIVRECARVAYRYSSNLKNHDHYDDVGWDCLPGDLKEHIKEHFGVGE